MALPHAGAVGIVRANDLGRSWAASRCHGGQAFATLGLGSAPLSGMLDTIVVQLRVPGLCWRR
ncbi:hypothetical protein M8494_19090 [Serratia ureilytica]